MDAGEDGKQADGREADVHQHECDDGDHRQRYRAFADGNPEDSARGITELEHRNVHPVEREAGESHQQSGDVHRDLTSRFSGQAVRDGD